MLPPGCDTLLDAPYTVVDAYGYALRFLTFEDLPEDERPDKSIWLNAEKLKAHFEIVNRERERKYSGKKDIEDPVDNDAASSLIVE